VLGHRSIQTTTMFSAGHETAAAARHYDNHPQPRKIVLAGTVPRPDLDMPPSNGPRSRPRTPAG
jgi:hypothetical protein